MCGHAKGIYTDNLNAEVTGGIAVAIGNGSFQRAIFSLYNAEDIGRDEWIERSKFLAWVRPNSGSGNPHTRLVKTIKEREKLRV